MRQAVEYVCGLRYKIQIIGIMCEGPAFIYGDNKSVLAKTKVPDSTLNNNMKNLSYHFVCEGCSRDEWRTEYFNMNFNLADLLTKPLPSGEKRSGFVRIFLNWLQYQ